MLTDVSLHLSGDRFQVTYRLTGNEAEARAKAEDICVEQTIEFPAELVPEGDIRSQIMGRIESLQLIKPGFYRAIISYPIEITSFELTQLINVIFGNISIKPGIRVEQVDLPPALLEAFEGPRFGQDGLRALLGVAKRPLLATALKPMGLSPAQLADQAYRCAVGGIDMIKDDHGLTNQAFSAYRERVEQCAEAVARANRETGFKCIYAPNVTAPADQVVDRALWARNAGAGGLLVVPGLIGLDTMRLLADDDRIGLPVLSHPAFQGSYVVNPDQGVSHYVLFGQFNRLAGADVTIFPNYGGRFSFTMEECQDVVAGASVPMGHIEPIFPAPAGGMTVERVPDMLKVYGREVVFLIGGGLHKRGPDLIANSRYFRELVEQMAA